MTMLQVALGGAIGAALRWWLSGATMRWLGPAFPWGTFVVNVLGALAMGVAAAVMMERLPGAWGRLRAVPDDRRAGRLHHVLGLFARRAVLDRAGRHAVAAAYMGGSVLACVLALWAGLTVTRGLL